MQSKKTALITGASGGIGYELSKLFADNGYNLVLVARDRKKLREVHTEINVKYGVEVKTIVKDLSEPLAPDEIFQELWEEKINISVLVNNAGYATFGPFTETDLDEELKMMHVNMIALAHLTKLFLPSMLDSEDGKILNVASTAAFQPGPFMAVYYATKAFVLSFTEAIANELKHSGVTVTALCPGPTKSGFQKRAHMENSKLIEGKIMDAELVAKLGYKGMMKGKTVVITGVRNKILTETIRITPRRVATNIVRRLQEKRK
ncbi:MAG: SDR family oxidoreductase [Bacteroidota bacterium]